jgi:hypothetical protein
MSQQSQYLYSNQNCGWKKATNTAMRGIGLEIHSNGTNGNLMDVTWGNYESSSLVCSKGNIQSD